MRRAFVIVLIAACGKQSFRDSIAALCDPDGGPKLANLNPAARQAAVQAWLEDHIRNQDGKDFIAVITSMRPWMRKHQILRTAEDEHIENCKPIAALAGMRSPLGAGRRPRRRGRKPPRRAVRDPTARAGAEALIRSRVWCGGA
jgi:hypothetical protein